MNRVVRMNQIDRIVTRLIDKTGIRRVGGEKG